MFFTTSQNWIPREFQREVVAQLYEFGLLKLGHGRSLPLKSGGKTDIYINLRDARDNPKAIKYVAELFEEPLLRLGISRFVEIPDSISCFAGPLAVSTGLPYLTVRGEAKEGRVSDAKIIGHPEQGDPVAMIDDVITDGASKIAPYRLCLEKQLWVKALVVLVDRQQGWDEYFLSHQAGGLRVWAGMTLHDVRRELIGMGAMERCHKELEKKNPIIVALDGKSWPEILPIVDSLRSTGCILKVNDLVFDLGMAHLLPELSVYGRVMVDLKSHDIPNTVENTCKRLARHNVWAVTVHASGGGEMVKAAVRALAGTDTKVLAITALTSLDDQKCKYIYGTESLETVKRLASIAFSSGADGVVCSPHEVPVLKQMGFREDKIYVTPGIRSLNAPRDDQERVSTPKGAMDNGSNYIVTGRQILGAENPIAEVRRVLTEELGIVL